MAMQFTIIRAVQVLVCLVPWVSSAESYHGTGKDLVKVGKEMPKATITAQVRISDRAGSPMVMAAIVGRARISARGGNQIFMGEFMVLARTLDAVTNPTAGETFMEQEAISVRDGKETPMGISMALERILAKAGSTKKIDPN